MFLANKSATKSDLADASRELSVNARRSATDSLRVCNTENKSPDSFKAASADNFAVCFSKSSRTAASDCRLAPPSTVIVISLLRF